MRGELSGSAKVYSPKFSTKELLRYLRKQLEALSKELPVKRAVLFGSYAKGTHTVASDVDLLIIYGDPERGDAYSIAWDRIKLSQLQLHLYTESQYERLKRSGSSFVREVERGLLVWKSDKKRSSSQA